MEILEDILTKEHGLVKFFAGRQTDISDECNSELRPIPSLWGHFTMFAIFEEDKKAIDDLLKELLAVPVEAPSLALR